MIYDIYSAPNGKQCVRPVRSNSVSTSDFIKDLESNTSLTSADGLATLTYLVHYLTDRLATGNVVTIDGIGTFTVALQLDDVVDKKITGSDVHLKRVAFKAAPGLKRDIAQKISGINRVHSAIRRTNTDIPDIENRRRRAVELAQRAGRFTASQYRHASGVSLTLAYADLATFVADGTLTAISYGRYRLYCIGNG